MIGAQTRSFSPLFTNSQKKRKNVECLERYNLLRKAPSTSGLAELLYVFGQGDYNLPEAKKCEHLAVKTKTSTAAVKVMQNDNKMNGMKNEFRETLKKDVINPYMLSAECRELLKKF